VPWFNPFCLFFKKKFFLKLIILAFWRKLNQNSVKWIIKLVSLTWNLVPIRLFFLSFFLSFFFIVWLLFVTLKSNTNLMAAIDLPKGIEYVRKGFDCKFTELNAGQLFLTIAQELGVTSGKNSNALLNFYLAELYERVGSEELKQKAIQHYRIASNSYVQSAMVLFPFPFPFLFPFSFFLFPFSWFLLNGSLLLTT